MLLNKVSTSKIHKEEEVAAEKLELRTKEEKEFYKSNQNFFKANGEFDLDPDNIKSLIKENSKISEETNSNTKLFITDDYIKKQLEESNRVNRYLKDNRNIYSKNEEAKKFNKDSEINIEKLSQYIDQATHNGNNNGLTNSITNVEEISIRSLSSDP